nr:MAG TPA: hypothetical protein [Caudoviricetes sp.]
MRTLERSVEIWKEMEEGFRNITVEANIESIIDSIEKLYKSYKSSDVEDLYVEMKWLQKDKDIDRHIDRCFDLISSIKEFSDDSEETLIHGIHYNLKVLEGYIEY